jgi:cytoskeleton protein RodZ
MVPAVPAAAEAQSVDAAAPVAALPAETAVATAPAAEGATQAPVETPDATTPAAPAEAKPTEAKPVETKPVDAVIKVQKPKGRVVLTATKASWIQVTSAKGDVLFRKVLRPGEQYVVPDEKGVSLDTANAGGLDIAVDGKNVQPVGDAGEIVRGVSLSPSELSARRQRVRR